MSEMQSREMRRYGAIRSTKALMLLELVADGVTVALFALATFGGILRLGEQV
jgi:hypothetical protein